MLESRVPRLQEATEISVDSAFGLLPVLDENGILANYIYKLENVDCGHVDMHTFR